jgi:2,5-diamino-6-(ribosylamino)-4(3H)-pyrimidinone 5'-phosphate reductase
VTKKPARLKEFEKTSQIFLIHAKRPAAPQIVKILLREGYRNLLVEGGGGLMWDFASKNLIDEYNVTLTPKIVGGSDSPTLVEGSGFTPAKILELKLLKSRVLGDEIYLTYGKRS